jgi:benzodiazapine receptor
MQTTSYELRVLTVFAGGTLAAGMLSAYVSFSLFPLERSYDLPEFYPPLWLFWLVWIFLYPMMGLAAGHVWLRRHAFDVKGPLTFYASILLTNFFFLPVANISNGNPAVMTFMDINGALTALLLGWLFSRYSRKALYCLLPLMLWMPVTTAFKIALWIKNPVF